MKNLMKKNSVEMTEDIPQECEYPIWKKENLEGKPYWGTASFWGLDAPGAQGERTLSQLEWDGNEVCLNAETEESVPDILRKAICIIAFWKTELETKYPGTPFYLLASYDNGDNQIVDEGETPVRSVTLRFWADRGDNGVIDLSDFDDWEQPLMVEYCGF